MHRVAVVLDQVAYSGTTFVASVIAARAMGVTAFGQFSLVVAVVLLVVGLQRASTLEPLLIASRDGRPSWRATRRSAMGMLGFTTSLALLAWATADPLFSAGPLAPALVAVALPLVQDWSRFLTLVNFDGRLMLLHDMIAACFQIGLMLVVVVAGVQSPTLMLAAWGAGAVAGPLVLAPTIVKRVLMTRRSPLEQNERLPSLRTAVAFGADYALGVVALQTTLWTAVAVGGYAASAALRGADAVAGPFRVLLQSLPALLLRRWSRATEIRRTQAAARVAATLSVPVIALAIVLAWFPAVGSPLFGDSWEVISPVVPYVVLALAPAALSYTCALGMKSLLASKALLLTRLIITPVTLILGFAGAITGGAVGAALGALVGSLLAATGYFIGLSITERRYRAT